MTRQAAYSASSRRVDFARQPSLEANRAASTKMDRRLIIKRIFIFFALLVLLLAIWYLLSAIVIRPITKRILQEELAGDDGADVLASAGQSNMSQMFSNALQELWGNRTVTEDGGEEE